MHALVARWDASESRDKLSETSSSIRQVWTALPDFWASLFREENRRASASLRRRLTPWNFPPRPGRSTDGEAPRVLLEVENCRRRRRYPLRSRLLLSSWRFTLPSSREGFSKSLHFLLKFCCFSLRRRGMSVRGGRFVFTLSLLRGEIRARTYRRVRPLNE